jgi:large subunit ribosomal protein L30
MAMAATIKITLIKSLAGQLQNISASVRGLGLRKVNQSISVQDTPQNRGMINTASHLLKVEKAA